MITPLLLRRFRSSKVAIPNVGDIVIFNDATKKVKFVAYNDYTTLPTGHTLVGVVAAIRENKALIAYKQNQAKKWSDVYQYKVSGWSLDGVSHTTNVVLHGTAAIAFTYTASTLAEVVSQFNIWLASNSPAGYTYKAVAENDEFILTLLTYAAYQGVHSFSGLTTTPFTGTELVESPNIYWDSTRTTYWAQMNTGRFYTYYKTYGRTPTAQVPLLASPADPVKQSEFNTNAFCDLLRNAYCEDASNPTDADYKNYLAKEFTVDKERGVLQPSFRDGHTNTYALVGKTYENEGGTRSPKYPAAEYCATVGFSGVDGLEVGDWFMPSVYDLFDIMGPVTYPAPNSVASNGDALNRSLAKIGGNQIGNGNSFCTSCRYSTNAIWYYVGGNGGANSYSFPFIGQTLPVALIDY